MAANHSWCSSNHAIRINDEDSSLQGTNTNAGCLVIFSFVIIFPWYVFSLLCKRMVMRQWFCSGYRISRWNYKGEAKTWFQDLNFNKNLEKLLRKSPGESRRWIFIPPTIESNFGNSFANRTSRCSLFRRLCFPFPGNLAEIWHLGFSMDSLTPRKQHLIQGFLLRPH